MIVGPPCNWHHVLIFERSVFHERAEGNQTTDMGQHSRDRAMEFFFDDDKLETGGRTPDSEIVECRSNNGVFGPYSLTTPQQHGLRVEL